MRVVFATLEVVSYQEGTGGARGTDSVIHTQIVHARPTEMNVSAEMEDV